MNDCNHQTEIGQNNPDAAGWEKLVEKNNPVGDDSDIEDTNSPLRTEVAR